MSDKKEIKKAIIELECAINSMDAMLDWIHVDTRAHKELSEVAKFAETKLEKLQKEFEEK